MIGPFGYGLVGLPSRTSYVWGMTNSKNTKSVSEKPNEIGPGQYSRRLCAAAEVVCELGGTEDDLAKALGISVNAVRRWKKEHKEFSDACKTGKELADNRVVRSIFERATGFSYETTKLHQHKGRVIKTKYKVYVPPDVAAAKFWIKNRQMHCWKEKLGAGHLASGENPLRALFKQIDGHIMRPKEQPNPC